MKHFVHEALPGRVVFGWGTLKQLPAEVAALGCHRALIITTPRQNALAHDILHALDGNGAGVFDGAKMHTPVAVTERALGLLRERGADCLVALGGGSTIGLAKALALRTDLPQIVVPTTYAGSEATPILGETKDGKKTTQRSPKILPEVILYDVSLTMSLAPSQAATSGMNAIAHAVEALYAKDVSPLITMLAEQGIASFAQSLPRIAADPEDRKARSDALYGAWACGVCLGSVGMALHHKLCHTLGGSFDLPHAETHTVLLPHAAAYNAAAAPEAMARAARALGAENAPLGLYELAKTLGAPTALCQIGMPESGLDRAADIAAENPYWNPRPIEREAIRTLLDNAYHGRPPITP
ncbi:MAG TPA: maleylacetate reductase [Stellaceae bacterium]|nr:maleylacetate reductase [Stellaceae bacterium]